MKKLPLFGLLGSLLVLGNTANAAISIYNQNSPPDATDLPGGGWGTYRGFSVRFNDAALSTTYTAGETSTPASIKLTSLVVRHPGNQGSAGAGGTAAYLKIYTTQTATDVSYVGESSNTNDMSQAGAERNLTFNFSNVALDPTVTYFFHLANTAGAPTALNPITFTNGRLRVSNNAGHTYSSGNLFSNTTGAQDSAFDAVFSATFVPEPSSALLGAIGALVLLRRRR